MSIFRLAAFCFLITAVVSIAPAQSSTEPATTPPNPTYAQKAHALDPSNASQTQAQPDSPSDNTCLKMRVYKVARDGPNTDSIHPAGYSTCSLAVRFRTYSVDEVIPQPVR
jgi:hypothetical protein